MTVLTPRQHRLWELLRDRERVTSSDVEAVCRRLGAPKTRTARADREALCRAGLLIPQGDDDRRWYRPAGALL